MFPIMSIVNITSTSFFNLALSDILVPILGLVWLIDIKNFSLKKNYPYWWYFGGLILVFLVSNVYNLNSNIVSSGVAGIVSEGIKFVISAIYLFIGYNSFKDKDELKNVLTAWVIGLWIFMVYGLYANFCSLNNINFWSFNSNFGNHARFLGTITDANAAGTYLTFSLFVVLMFIYLFKDKKIRIFGYATIGFIFICLILTQSRGSWIGFSFGIGLLILINIKKLYKLLIFVIPLSIILFFGFATANYYTNDALGDRLIGRVEEVSEGEGQSIIRPSLTKMAIGMGLDNPMLGVGRGNFVLNSKPYADKVYDKRDDFVYNEITRVVPHTTFIGMFAELGILGFIVFSSIFIVLFYKMFKYPKKINIIIIICMLCFFVESLALNLENFRGLWLFLAIALAIQDKDIDADVFNEKIVLKNTYKYFGLSMAVAFIVYIFASVRIPTQIRLKDNIDYSFNIPISSYEPIELIYYVKGEVEIEIYEDEVLIESEKYSATSNGFVKKELLPIDEMKEYRILFSSDSEDVSKLRNIYYKQGNKNYSLIGYKYLPKFAENIFNKIHLLVYKDYSIRNSKVSDYPIDFGDYTLLDTKINNADGYSEIEFNMKLNKEIKTKEALQLTYSNDDIINLPNQQNIMKTTHSIEDIFKDAQIGDTVTFKTVFKGENIDYNVNASIGNKVFYLGSVKPNSLSLDKYLKNLDEDKLVIITIRDEGTNGLNYKVINEFQKFDFKEDLKGKSRYSYIAVGSKNSSVGVYEDLKKELIQKEFNKGDKLGDYIVPFDATIVSAGYTVGNRSNTVIDGVEYSKQTRGMNIVVYDMKLNKVVDSITFDTYSSIYK